MRWECDDYLPSPNINRLHPNPLKHLGSRVADKLEEGDFKGAVHIASSVESFAPNNAETLSALRSKHPAPHPNSLMPPPFPPDQLQGLQVSCEEVVGAIKSFPAVQQEAQMESAHSTLRIWCVVLPEVVCPAC